MAKIDPRIDAYIAKSADFAKPILTHLRELIHEGCPEVEETLKWSMPAFIHKGILCNLAAFKAHCAFGFWKSKLIFQSHGKNENAMGQFGRITSLRDLPSNKVLLGYIRQAAKLNEDDVKVPSHSKPKAKKELVVPDYFMAALRKNTKALKTFEGFSYSHKKEYVEWITEAKRGETRNKRIATTLLWLSQGKGRNWKYENC